MAAFAIRKFVLYGLLSALFISLAFSLPVKQNSAIRPSSISYHSSEFSFFLKKDALTSAGVYQKDGTLIRTLWSGVQYSAGTHNAIWDGTDDEGRLANNGNYEIKVLSNNVNYTWEGVIGNTSSEFTGPNIHRGLSVVEGITIVNKTAYYAAGYNEQGSSTCKFNTNKPQSRTTILDKGLAVEYVTHDDKNVYWAGKEPGIRRYLIYATNIENDKEVSFRFGKQHQVKNAYVYSSAIDITPSQDDNISGLTVQKNGIYLFASHTKSNEIHVFNKFTGELVRKVSMPSPKGIIADNNKNLWVIFDERGKDVVGKFTVSENGDIVSNNLNLTNLQQPLAMALSPDNSTLLVADGGISQQLKFYSANSGKLKQTFGQAGGYQYNATVTDDKFYFSDNRDVLGTSICYQQDGSYWVVDKGNYRIQHYSAGNTFINNIMYLPRCYSIAVDANKPTRVFANYLEFEIDYNKPLKPDNHSWRLVKNWGATISQDDDSKYGCIRNVNTLSNGHTYALIGGGGSKPRCKVVELTQNHNLRYTGIELPKSSQLYADGSIRLRSKLEKGKDLSWEKRPLVKFDQDGNPVWGDVQQLAKLPFVSQQDPVCKATPAGLPAEINSLSTIISFNANHSIDDTRDWHLGRINYGSNKWLWRTAYGTPRRYRGDFPSDGSYDNGNGVRYAGSIAVSFDPYIFWGYHGEFWKNSQVNKWNQLNSDGLFIGQFGMVGTDIQGQSSPAGMAGNSFSAAVVKSGDTLYLYHNDENHHSGVHRWKITGLNTIQEQTIPVTLSTAAHGLTAAYFLSTDLNNLYFDHSTLEKSVVFKAHDKLKPSAGTIATLPLSVRYTGFITPLYNEKYYFGISDVKDVRIWVDNQLVVDNTSRQQLNEPILLQANVNYPIKIEYTKMAAGNDAYLYWQSASEAKGAIPESQFRPAEIADASKTFDLLQGLPHEQSLLNNMYGWKRRPEKDDSTQKYTKWWEVNTNILQYNRYKSPDLYVKFRQQAGSATVTRDLGDSKKPVNFWQIAGIVNYTGNEPNRDAEGQQESTGGSAIEVIDQSGKTLVKLLYFINNTTNRIQYCANNKVVFETDREGMQKLIRQSLPLSITMQNEIIAVKYGSFNEVKVTVNDSAADLHRPQSFQLRFWSSKRSANRAIDLQQLTYYYK